MALHDVKFYALLSRSLLIETRWRELNTDEVNRSVGFKLIPHINEMILGETGLMEKMFRFVDELLVPLNNRIEEQLREGEDSWLFEDVESLHGIAFVAGQRYISATCGAWKVAKRDALMLGQKTVNRTTYATVVNATGRLLETFGSFDTSERQFRSTMQSRGGGSSF